jgi:autotransporter-associated beta strand protein
MTAGVIFAGRVPAPTGSGTRPPPQDAATVAPANSAAFLPWTPWTKATECFFRGQLGLLIASVASVAMGQLAVERITSGPTGFAGPVFGVSAPGDPSRLYVVEQGGQVRLIDTTSPTAAPQPFLSLTNANFPNSNLTTGGEQGLLGLAFHPEYQSNGLFYTFSTANSGNDLRVDQFRSVNGVVQTGLRRTVLSIPHPSNTNHNGGWIGFSPTGGTSLYVATGDGGGGNDPANNSQNTGNLLGKMVRIDVGASGLPFDGTTGGYGIPAGNMTVNPNGNLTNPAPPTTTVRPEIYAYGLRNPWRNSFDRLTGDLYIADVGQGAREEINVIPAGRENTGTLDREAGSLNGINFGWRLREGSITTPTVGSAELRYDNVQPVFDYVRSGTSGQLPFYGRSVTGGFVYRGPDFHDGGVDLEGTYLFADYVSNQIGSFRYDPGTGSITDVRNRTTEIRSSLPAGVSLSGIASFAEDGAGKLYILSATSGDIFRVVAAQPDGPLITVAAGATRTQAAAGYPVIEGGFSVVKAGAGDVVFDAANSFTGPTTVSAGTLSVAHFRAVAGSAVSVESGATLSISTGITMRSPAVLLAGGRLVATSLAIDSVNGIAALTVAGGTLVGGPAVSVADGGLLSLASDARVAIGLGLLAVDESPGGGRVDLGAGQVTVAVAGPMAADVRADILAGRNGGDWNGGTGITSSLAAGSAGTRAVGYIVASDGAIRVSYAAPGDVDLNGSADVFDLVGINGAGTYGTGSQSDWSRGDFNYDGVTSVFDLVMAGGAGVYGGGRYFPAVASSSAAVAAVPEPFGCVVIAAAGLAAILTTGRRRQSRPAGAKIA